MNESSCSWIVSLCPPGWEAACGGREAAAVKLLIRAFPGSETSTPTARQWQGGTTGRRPPPSSLPPLGRCVSEKQVDPLSAAWKWEQNFARCLLGCLGRFVCTVEEFLCACSDSPALFERHQRFALKRLLINKSEVHYRINRVCDIRRGCLSSCGYADGKRGLFLAC